MRKILTALTVFACVASLPTVAYATSCSGKWSDGASTSIRFKAGNKLRYCYKSRCWNSTYTGKEGKKIRFKIGKTQAKVSLTPSGSNKYKAFWSFGGNASRGSYSCR